MAKYEHKWRVLTHGEKAKYATAMRRLNLGCWGYPISTLRAVHLTTREGNDNSPRVFAKDLRKMVNSFRGEGYDLEYNGALEYSPGKDLLHWHGLFRIKGGYFIRNMVKKEEKAKVRRILGDRWNECHGAFVVKIDPMGSEDDLKNYILKHILKEYIGEDESIRNKFLFSRGWMRGGWKDIESLAKTWVLGGLNTSWMDSEKWKLVNEIVKAWAEKREVMFPGRMVNGKETGYLYMKLGRIYEVVGGAFEHCDFEYYDY